MSQFLFRVKIFTSITGHFSQKKPANHDLYSGEQKCQNGLENQMISKLCLENRNFFQTACDYPSYQLWRRHRVKTIAMLRAWSLLCQSSNVRCLWKLHQSKQNIYQSNQQAASLQSWRWHPMKKHSGWGKMAGIQQVTISNPFAWTEVQMIISNVFAWTEISSFFNTINSLAMCGQ